MSLMMGGVATQNVGRFKTLHSLHLENSLATYNICFEICFHYVIVEFISLDDLLYITVEINIED
jgi:hypothetical protein